MYQTEIIKSTNEDDLVKQINYFLKQIDEMLVKDIQYSSFAFSNGEENEIIFSAMIIYLVK